MVFVGPLVMWKTSSPFKSSCAAEPPQWHQEDPPPPQDVDGWDDAWRFACFCRTPPGDAVRISSTGRVSPLEKLEQSGTYGDRLHLFCSTSKDRLFYHRKIGTYHDIPPTPTVEKSRKRWKPQR